MRNLDLTDEQYDERDDVKGWRPVASAGRCECGWIYLDDLERAAGCPACRVGIQV